MTPEIEEAARLDGAGRLRVLVEIVLPVAFPALAAVGILPALWMTTRTRTNVRTQEGKPVKHVNAQS